ncbi:hypothetical protein [Cytophaga aurantiaca]|uniref:hypothetical protein n=1 Tax=Cytophaga aurantiaca TaxID=29530 RepID=UPI001FE0F1B8|nr:hypothetical protein [Cytophaga aurantiaca]
MNRDHLADVSYPIVFKYDNQALMHKNEDNTKITFHAYGLGWDLLKLKLNWFVDPIEIDITNRKKYRYVLASEIRPYLEDKLPIVEIRYFISDTLYTGLDKVKKDKMKIYVDREPTFLADDYKIDGNIRINPEYIVVTGPASILDTMSHKIVVKVSDNNIADAYKEEISLPKPSNPQVKYGADKVEVSFNVTKYKRPFTQ